LYAILGRLLHILGRGFRIARTWLGRQFLILGSRLLLGSLGNLLGFDIIRIPVDMLEEFVARWEGFGGTDCPTEAIRA